MSENTEVFLVSAPRQLYESNANETQGTYLLRDELEEDASRSLQPTGFHERGCAVAAPFPSAHRLPGRALQTSSPMAAHRAPCAAAG